MVISIGLILDGGGEQTIIMSEEVIIYYNYNVIAGEKSVKFHHF